MAQLADSHPGTRSPASAPATKLVGLIGCPVEHSLSPAMHNAAFAQLDLPLRYLLLPTPPGELGERIGQCVSQGFTGWNVTVPHKESMLAYLSKESDEVRATGACNTVRVVGEGGRLQGFNTDVTGFMRGLEEAGGVATGSRAVLLGAGGAARAVAWALSQAGHEVHILSRRREQAASLAQALSTGTSSPLRHGALDSASLAHSLQGASLLVNCTPAGMWPHVEASPLPDEVSLSGELLVYDLVYRPRSTKLLREATLAGCRTQDGLAMLVHQGAAAFELWTGKQASLHIMRQACLDALRGACQ